MLASLKRSPLIVGSVTGYALFAVGTMTWEGWLLFVWPFQILVSLQKLIGPENLLNYIVVWAVGLLIVGGWGYFLSSVTQKRPRNRATILGTVLSVSVMAWYVPFFLARLSGSRNVIMSGVGVIACVLGGAFLIYFSLRKFWPEVHEMGPIGVAVAFISWYIPLLLTQGITMGMAWTLGWPLNF